MDIKNRNLFRLTRFILLKVPVLFRVLSVFRKQGKRVLIIKTDAIGDYILFRNFIEVLKTSEKYKNYQLDVLGNRLWADIALKYDTEFVNKFFFINAESLYESPLKALRLGWKLFWRNYEVVLQPAYSRTFINDGLAALTAAKEIVGFKSDNERIDEKYKRKTDGFYMQLFDLPADCYFELDRSKYFFEKFLNTKLPIAGPYLDCGIERSDHIVVFMGAGVVKREWEREKFLELVKLIIQNASNPVQFAGGPAEAATAKYLMDNLPAHRITNLTGKTTLPQLVELIAGAKLVISNETSAIHIAAATKTPCVCILGGGHFGRFAPYPAHINHKPICVYDKMECFNCNWNCIYQTQPNAPHPCISIVGVGQVWNIVKSIVH